jgi:hypothetical protein
MGAMRNIYKYSAVNPERKTSLGKPKRRSDNIKIGLT